MGNTSGIKWNGINDAGTLQSSYEIILRDTKTNNEEKILLPDFFNQAVTLGLIPSGGSGWGLTGNAGTDPNVNFLGTTDATSLILKSNNKALFEIAEYSFLLTTEDFVTPVNSAISIQADLAGSSLLMSCNNSSSWQINADAMGLNCIFNNSNQSNMFIEYGTGNVGIGTPSPAYKLDVAGMANVAFTDGSSNQYLFTINDADGIFTKYTGVDGNYTQSLITGDYSLVVADPLASVSSTFNVATNIITLSVDSIGPGSTGLSIENNKCYFEYCNVGIGTASPASKLTVDGGDIEVIGDTNGLILESPDNTRYRVTVANGGTLTVTAV